MHKRAAQFFELELPSSFYKTKKFTKNVMFCGLKYVNLTKIYLNVKKYQKALAN